MNWARGQKKYIKYKVEEEEANYFSLTPLGKRVLKASRVNG
jgi:DNA-binding PadR family transcriptional regulator